MSANWFQLRKEMCMYKERERGEELGTESERENDKASAAKYYYLRNLDEGIEELLYYSCNFFKI